jgi:predicted NUDIX family NTP pyrophosphohydrolase
MFRHGSEGPEVLLVHPGGPFWAGKDAGAWSLPKGELAGGAEDPLEAARREFVEETGFDVSGPFTRLAPVKLKSGKVIEAWTFEGDCDPQALRSNSFSMEWPPRSGRQQEFPEIDKAAFFRLDEARRRIHPGQLPFLVELEARLKSAGGISSGSEG